MIEAREYKGARLCGCGHRAQVNVTLGHVAILLCWDCVNGLVGILQELFARTQGEE